MTMQKILIDIKMMEELQFFCHRVNLEIDKKIARSDPEASGVRIPINFAVLNGTLSVGHNDPSPHYDRGC